MMPPRRFHWLLLLTLCAAGCKKKEEKKSNRKLHEEAWERNSSRHLSVTKFADALREIHHWRLQQPGIADRKMLLAELVRRYKSVRVNGLPPEMLAAWQEMLLSWQVLARESTLTPEQHERGTRAANALRKLFEAEGILDLPI